MVERVNKRGQMNELVSKWTRPWRVVTAAGSQHVCGVEDTNRGKYKQVHVARNFTTLKNQGEIQMEAIRAMATSADDDTEMGDTSTTDWS